MTGIVVVIILATYWLLGTARIPFQAHWSEQWNDDRDRARAGGEESVCHNVSAILVTNLLVRDR